MARVFPYVPENITVHLGTPSSNADNVTVGFADYIKNVASSEIYPTWEKSAILANVNAQVSYALNRVYIEFYRSRGYDFDITNTTAYDQRFIYGRTIFENISEVVDEYFDTYIRRQGFIEPLAAKYCNGTTTTCEGLSQWGSQELASEGLNSVQILKNYYGDNIEIVVDAPVKTVGESYPGYDLSEGSDGDYVLILQTSLNRISQNFPLIPKISPVSGYFGEKTREAVEVFQNIFGIEDTGVVNKATWYKIVLIYTAVLRLDQLNSEGQQLFGQSLEYPDDIKMGDKGEKVIILQYFLSVLSSFYPTIPDVIISGDFEQKTYNSVVAAQKCFGHAQNGIVADATWNEIYDAYKGIVETVFMNREIFPVITTPFDGQNLEFGSSGETVADLQKYINSSANSLDSVNHVKENGLFGRHTRWSIIAHQKENGLPQTGIVDRNTWNSLADTHKNVLSEFSSRPAQNPGIVLRENDRDGDRI